MFLPSSKTASCGFKGRSEINLSIDVCVAPPSLTLLRYAINSSIDRSLSLLPSLSMNSGPILLHAGTKNPHLVFSYPSSHILSKDNTLNASGL